jgi:RHS repeat-associated protein
MADGHGSTRFLTDTNGVISDRYSYDAYGVALDFTFGTLNSPRTAMLYSGERFDSDLQQYYLRARYYNPTVGRFGAQDQQDGTPNDPLSLHKYAYCQNNPVNGRDPSGNDDLASLTMAMSIGASLDAVYNGAALLAGYRAGAKVTEIGQSFNSTVDAASRDASPGVDTATIIVHGVGPGHPNGWSKDFQNSLTLNHDFYEFNWGGFSIDDSVPLTLTPIKSVHEMALVQLQMEEMLVSMNGYANIDIISHSWGTCLSYDLLNNSGIEVHDWVTMGSPLKQTTQKPAMNSGKWINYYDPNDKVTHLEIFPPFPNLPLYASWHLFALSQGIPSFGNGLADDPNITQGYNREYDFRAELGWHLWVHSDYWISQKLQAHLHNDLQ